MKLGILALSIVPLTGCPSAGQDSSTTKTTRIESIAPKFSGDSAYLHIKTQVAFGPRVPGTAGHKNQLAWMKQYLRTRADTVIEQPFSYRTTTGKDLQLTNLLARFNSAAADRILLLAHWDTRPTANEDPDDSKHAQPVMGANDGGSGVAVLMEIANILARTGPPVGVDLLFVDGEDYGPTGEDMYIGARYFAANLPAGYKPLYGILVDMVGDEKPVYPIEAHSQKKAPEVVDRVWRTAEQLGLGNYFRRSSGGEIGDDHIPLNQAGIRTIDIIDFDYPYWHTTQDILEHTSPVGLGVVGTVLLEVIFREGK